MGYDLYSYQMIAHESYQDNFMLKFVKRELFFHRGLLSAPLCSAFLTVCGLIERPLISFFIC